MIGELLSIIFSVLALTWWLWPFIILLPLTLSTLVFWRQEHFAQTSTPTVLLELRIPREIKKSARAMEQVLAAMSTLRSGPLNVKDHYMDGKFMQSFSLEVASFGGEVHFYIRVPERFRNLVEAPLFSYYSDVEIVPVEDYTTRFPEDTASMYEAGQDLWGTELVLSKDSAFPIKTYEAFETLDEETQFDPISTMLEVLGKLKQGEVIALQIVIAPASPRWAAHAKDVIKVLRGESKPASTPSGLAGAVHAVREVATEVSMLAGDGGSGKKEGGADRVPLRTPGETDLIKAVEANVSKPAFDTLIRIIYLAPKSIFSTGLVASGIAASFNQYSAAHLNSFVPNWGMAVAASPWKRPHLFVKERLEHRKSRMLYNFKHRETPPDTWMGKLLTSTLFHWNFQGKRFPMTTESLATIFHPPTAVVLTAPHLRRMESRKVGPAAGLAIYGDEESIEKFL